MSQKIDPREVLSYLNELGYTNISAQQLKEFIVDLKKLIKHENKHRRYKLEKENVDPIASQYSGPQNDEIAEYSSQSCSNNIYKMQGNENNIFNSLYNQPTVCSRAKTVPRENRLISVQIVRPKSRLQHEHCVHTDTGIKAAENKEQLQLIENIELTSDGSKLALETESTIKSIRSCSKQTVTSPSSKVTKPKSSFIRSEVQKPLNRCDPVALYQYYQKEWKKQKFPGQEMHSDLRWAVREKMLSGPRVNSISRPSSCQRSCYSWKG